eukprot:TRINITY_DN1119_c0_g1_i1.p1 TRINITY_DN1119_c0_g1~~TRINITY_DN1119_c0_g1_i1.p1  ORF type:complete len:1029 (+),score=296.47 TRINITY_DN1119_c0_g1_i1:51-3137(+)
MSFAGSFPENRMKRPKKKRRKTKKVLSIEGTSVDLSSSSHWSPFHVPPTRGDSAAPPKMGVEPTPPPRPVVPAVHLSALSSVPEDAENIGDTISQWKEDQEEVADIGAKRSVSAASKVRRGTKSRLKRPQSARGRVERSIGMPHRVLPSKCPARPISARRLPLTPAGMQKDRASGEGGDLGDGDGDGDGDGEGNGNGSGSGSGDGEDSLTMRMIGRVARPQSARSSSPPSSSPTSSSLSMSPYRKIMYETELKKFAIEETVHPIKRERPSSAPPGKVRAGAGHPPPPPRWAAGFVSPKPPEEQRRRPMSARTSSKRPSSSLSTISSSSSASVRPKPAPKRPQTARSRLERSSSSSSSMSSSTTPAKSASIPAPHEPTAKRYPTPPTSFPAGFFINLPPSVRKMKQEREAEFNARYSPRTLSSSSFSRSVASRPPLTPHGERKFTGKVRYRKKETDDGVDVKMKDMPKPRRPLSSGGSGHRDHRSHAHSYTLSQQQSQSRGNVSMTATQEIIQRAVASGLEKQLELDMLEATSRMLGHRIHACRRMLVQLQQHGPEYADAMLRIGSFHMLLQKMGRWKCLLPDAIDPSCSSSSSASSSSVSGQMTSGMGKVDQIDLLHGEISFVVTVVCVACALHPPCMTVLRELKGIHALVDMLFRLQPKDVQPMLDVLTQFFSECEVVPETFVLECRGVERLLEELQTSNFALLDLTIPTCIWNGDGRTQFQALGGVQWLVSAWESGIQDTRLWKVITEMSRFDQPGGKTRSDGSEDEMIGEVVTPKKPLEFVSLRDELCRDPQNILGIVQFLSHLVDNVPEVEEALHGLHAFLSGHLIAQRLFQDYGGFAVLFRVLQSATMSDVGMLEALRVITLVARECGPDRSAPVHLVTAGLFDEIPVAMSRPSIAREAAVAVGTVCSKVAVETDLPPTALLRKLLEIVLAYEGVNRMKRAHMSHQAGMETGEDAWESSGEDAFAPSVHALHLLCAQSEKNIIATKNLIRGGALRRVMAKLTVDSSEHATMGALVRLLEAPSH